MKKLGLFLGLSVLAASHSFSGGYCTEKITKLIIDSENIHFKSSKTCDGWCKIDSSWSEEQKDRAYSMLLAARTTDREVDFYWEQLNASCEKKLDPGNSPAVIYY